MEEAFLIKLAGEPPTDLNLSAISFNEGISIQSVIATLSTLDQDTVETFTYALVDGEGDTDNSAFVVEGNQLTIVDSPDFESKNSYSIRIQTKDSGGLTFVKAFTLSVNDLDEIPVVQSLDDLSTQTQVTTFKIQESIVLSDKEVDMVLVCTKWKDNITGTSDSEVFASMKGKNVLKEGEALMVSSSINQVVLATCM